MKAISSGAQWSCRVILGSSYFTQLDPVVWERVMLTDQVDDFQARLLCKKWLSLGLYMLDFKRTDRVRNEAILQAMCQKPLSIKQRQLLWLGHILRAPKMTWLDDRPMHCMHHCTRAIGVHAYMGTEREGSGPRPANWAILLETGSCVIIIVYIDQFNCQSHTASRALRRLRNIYGDCAIILARVIVNLILHCAQQKKKFLYYSIEGARVAYLGL